MKKRNGPPVKLPNNSYLIKKLSTQVDYSEHSSNKAAMKTIQMQGQQMQNHRRNAAESRNNAQN